MTPTPQEYGQKNQEAVMDSVPDDAVVISGVSGLMPGCDSFLDFGDKLYMKVNLTK